jgi:uncharacterized protein YbjT (DUF2867 family)
MGPQPVRGIQASRECGVGDDAAAARQPVLETGREPMRHDVEVHDIGQHGGAGGRGGGAPAPGLRGRDVFKASGPENRTGVVDREAQGGVAQAGAVAPESAPAPDPVADVVDGSRGGIVATAGEGSEHQRRNEAGDTAGQPGPSQRLAQRRGRPLRVLVAGASGLVGSAIVDRLVRVGHLVVPGVRNPEACRLRWPHLRPRRLDYTDLAGSEQWREAVAGIDVVVNAVGIFVEQGNQSFDALHVNGPALLFAAAAEAGVGRVVQVSALGAAADSPFEFLASKGRADAALRRMPLVSVVVRPSLVYAACGDSTRAFARLAGLPVTPVPGDGGQRIQPLHLDDLCDALVRVIEEPTAPARLDAVGAAPLALRDYLAMFKRAMGQRCRFVGVPVPLVRRVLRLAGAGRRGPVVANDAALSMLLAGNTADSGPMVRLLGRPLRPVWSYVHPAEALAMRDASQLAWLLPLMRLAVAAMWLVTAGVSLFGFPIERSLELLARTGLHGAGAQFAFYGAVLLDLVLGIATLAMRRRQVLYRVQIGLVLFYTAAISAHLPGFWLHPYGPVLKNIPVLALLLLLHQLDGRRGGPAAG